MVKADLKHQLADAVKLKHLDIPVAGSNSKHDQTSSETVLGDGWIANMENCICDEEVCPSFLIWKEKDVNDQKEEDSLATSVLSPDTAL